MAKSKTQYVCQECGYTAVKWLGHCPGCGKWNTLAEEPVLPETAGRYNLMTTKKKNEPQPITAVDAAAVPRILTGVREFDRVLGGGIVPGALLLLCGDPGIGKSTLLLNVAGGISRKGQVLYVSGEESAAQTRLRADRLGELHDDLLILTETNLDEVISQGLALRPLLVVIDSIQTMYSEDIPSAPGSVGQVREATGKLLRFAKESGIAVCIIGHVTKDGNIAGPRLLEHMVDVVLYFEGERSYSFRVLRAIKNRFGSTNESGIFTMEDTGLLEVKNPAGLLLAERMEQVSGSVIMACMEGTRPIMVEIQALVAETPFGMPRRTAAGFDFNRVILLVAVLEKRVGLSMGNHDVYVNAVGGFKVNEPAADLAVVLAMASAFRNAPIDSHTVVIGEVGLTGEVRAVGRADVRIREAAAMGFRHFIVPQGNFDDKKAYGQGIEVIGVRSVSEAMGAVFG